MDDNRVLDAPMFPVLSDVLAQQYGKPRTIARRTTFLDYWKLDVEAILAFAERVLPRASDLWAQASLDQRQRLQQLFFPDGIAFDEMRFVRTGVNSPAFNYLTTIEPSKTNLVGAGGIEPPTPRV